MCHLQVLECSAADQLLLQMVAALACAEQTGINTLGTRQSAS